MNDRPLSHWARKDKIPRLGVNIDHIATLRQLRGTPYPDILEAARAAEAGGAEQITVHLREDRRHIQDDDVKLLRKKLKVPLNFEMSLAEPIVRLGVKLRPEWVCLVPEKRQELTTEGGLDLKKNKRRLELVLKRFERANVKVSLFIEPSTAAVKQAFELGAQAVEIHTGKYCLATQAIDHARIRGKKLTVESKKRLQSKIKKEWERVEQAALKAHDLGIAPHAGHGLDYTNIREMLKIQDPEGFSLIEEYNIGHSIICRAALVGLEAAVREMKSLIVSPA